MSVPNRLRLLRQERGLTQKELAKLAGLHPSQVSDVERGLHRRATLEKLALVLGEEDPERLLEVKAVPVGKE